MYVLHTIAKQVIGQMFISLRYCIQHFVISIQIYYIYIWLYMYRTRNIIVVIICLIYVKLYMIAHTIQLQNKPITN